MNPRSLSSPYVVFSFSVRHLNFTLMMQQIILVVFYPPHPPYKVGKKNQIRRALSLFQFLTQSFYAPQTYIFFPSNDNRLPRKKSSLSNSPTSPTLSSTNPGLETTLHTICILRHTYPRLRNLSAQMETSHHTRLSHIPMHGAIGDGH